MSVTYINKFKRKAGKGSDVLGWLKPAMEGVKGAPGVQRAELVVDPEDPDTIVSIEVWESREAHQTFVASVNMDVPEVHATLDGPPQGTYYDPV